MEIKEGKRLALPYVGGIIERYRDGKLQVLIQTRNKPKRDPKYSGTFEFPAGVLNNGFENVFDTLGREIREETGLTLKNIKNLNKSKVYSPQGDDEAIGFQPFYCTQQLKNGLPWIGFVFICEVEEGVEPVAQKSEVRDVKWMDFDEVKDLFYADQGKFFTLEVPAWDKYFKSR
ncbi:NUDIX domain-containing protein [Candidatus Dojkabacteria bacterium]|nr:NUDIX domain-containing protein [Candidatus Dojkabacteria bacterium]